MSILRVANLQFNASGTKRIDYDAVADDGIIKISAEAVRFPVGSNGTRPPSEPGLIRYNSDVGYMEFGGPTQWIQVASNSVYDVANASYAATNVAYNASNAAYTQSNTVNTFAYGVAANAAAAFAAANNVGPQIAPAFNTANAAYGVANTALQNTSGVSFNGNLYIPSGSLGIGNTTPGHAKVHITSANTVGGVGYADFLRVTNASYPAITNPIKTFRLNQSGGLEVINDAYTAVIMSLGNDGSFGVGSRGISKSSMPSGSVLQAVSTTKTDTFSTAVNISASGGSYTSTGTTVTGLTATITPTSSSSKILVMVNLNGMGTPGVAQLYCLLYRDSTLIGNPSPVSARPGVMARTHSENGVVVVGTCSFSHLDSPGTTSAVTYSIKVGGENSGTVYVNRSSSDGDTTNGARMSSTITVMEIAQ